MDSSSDLVVEVHPDAGDAGQKTSTGEDATGLVLSVTIPGLDPYQAQVGMYVPPAALALLAPGIELPGKALTGNNDAVAIDWTAFLRNS
jgi:hypothetical protein